ncbi:MAG: hypothetical protein KDI27_02345 [Gammaproteobacteria bacterium]|nr:hypothetical protein [Gammaproteobacteria bacterium]MCB1852939.1 hypothetical protein [Gammaproteobacteria bacterium]MCP5416989.1 hypothetical protein [Chromatiaceae bacterium]
MKILSLGCKTMREGVIASSIFFLAGILLIVAGSTVVPEMFYMRHVVMLLGLITLLFAPIILISTFLLSVLPGAKEKLEKCEH